MVHLDCDEWDVVWPFEGLSSFLAIAAFADVILPSMQHVPIFLNLLLEPPVFCLAQALACLS